MHKLRSYINSNFSKLFFSIFLPLIAVASIILLVKIATVTAVVKLDLIDMTKLYFYFMPQVLFMTIPISFFVAGVLTIHRFSLENELIVMFALGIKPNQIIKIITMPAIFLSVMLLMTSLIIIPHAEQLYFNYLNYKRSTAKFNISASEFGQRFGEWILFIENENLNHAYKNVALFRPEGSDKKEYFAIADSARFSNADQQLQFKLTMGKTFIYDPSNLTQINFNKMQINDTSILSQLTYVDSIQYWKDMNKRTYRKTIFTISIMMSLLPLLSVFFYVAVGTVNARHSKGYTYLLTFLGFVAYFGMFLSLSSKFDLNTIPISSAIWLITTYLFYRLKVVRRY